MFGFIKSLFCSSCGPKPLDRKHEDAVRQDKEVREELSEKQIDKALQDTMDASDPVAKY
ncbi:MAG: hypothetical protein WC989_03625 [Micavibrio sp.]